MVYARVNDINNMIAAVEAEVVSTREPIGRRELGRRVIAAMRKVPREEFVAEELPPFAFDNPSLTMGYSKTISQPYIVVLMTDLLEPDEDDRVLEVGTGSGYQVAVLSLLVEKVYSIKIVKELSQQVCARLKK